MCFKKICARFKCVCEIHISVYKQKVNYFSFEVPEFFTNQPPSRQLNIPHLCLIYKNTVEDILTILLPKQRTIML